jgi:hypothetical protein
MSWYEGLKDLQGVYYALDADGNISKNEFSITESGKTTYRLIETF